MTSDAFGLLFVLVVVGGMLILGLLSVRIADQERRDAQRVVNHGALPAEYHGPPDRGSGALDDWRGRYESRPAAS